MPQQSSFRQVDEKNVSTDVELMEWSPKMDLIALANVQGEVVLHRLSWQKVWSLASRGENIKVRCLAWRPDGKVLASGYTSGHVLLVDVENSEILHTIELNTAVTIAKWIAASEEHAASEQQKLCFMDNSSQFLPKLPSLSKSYGSLSKLTEETMDDSKKLNELRCLNVLIIGTEAGRLLLYIFGIFPAGDICPDEAANAATILQSLSSQTTENIYPPTRILSATVADNLANLSVVIETKHAVEDIEVKVLSFQTPLLAARYLELQVLSLKYGKILSLMGYLNTTIQSISEAWEDILLEIDSKLTNYAEEKYRRDSGTVSDDFLELLMFGTTTPELEKFLMYDLTEKGLKKLGHSIELSYSNIQKLVLKHLQSVGNAIVYHLSEIKGMALWYEKFGMFGLCPDLISNALIAAGSFMMKATEIQQVIDNSMRNFKSFFRWLYVVILRLSDEPIPSEINKVNQQDLNFVAEFLMDNFAHEWNHSNNSSFNLERVGQYLKNENLLFPPDTSLNPWVNFLESHPHVAACKLLIPHHREKSLVQQHAELQEAVLTALNRPSIVMSQALQLNSSFVVNRGDKSSSCLSQMYCNEAKGLLTIVTLHSLPAESAVLLFQDVVDDSTSTAIVKAIRIKFDTLRHENISSKKGQMFIQDMQFYSTQFLSVLLVDDTQNPVITQVPLGCVIELMQPITLRSANELTISEQLVTSVNVGEFIELGHLKLLENIKPLSIAVSSSRKVACVLFVSRRRVRLFDMDVEEDDEELDETEDRSSYSGWEKEQNESESTSVKDDENETTENTDS